MGYLGHLEEKIKAQNLRGKGFSYREILQRIDVSKSTISLWCRDIVLTEKQKTVLLQKKKFGQRKGSMIAAENKRNVRKQKIEACKNAGIKDLGKLSKRDKFLAGIALYAGEGYKTDGKAGFTNSDPSLINFMMEWFTLYADVPLEKMRGAIWLHEGLNEKKAKEFWSRITGIPLNQFHKTYIARVKNDSKKIRKNLHPYGIFAIRFFNSATHRKIMGWIYGLFGDRIINIPR